MIITEKKLHELATHLNKIQGLPIDRFDEETRETNVGHCYVDFAYGAVALYKIDNKQGGVMDVFGCGHVPKRQLASLMKSYVKGLEDAKKEKPAADKSVHLIAAAPEMLSALEYALEYMEDLGIEDKKPLDAIKKAIAKARGEL